MVKTRILAINTPDKVGKVIKIAGRVAVRRDHGKLVFVDLVDRSGIVQVVGGPNLGELRVQDVIEIEGIVQHRPKDLVNPKIETGKVEVKAEKFKILAKAQELPFDLGPQDLAVSLPTLLDHRALTLRHPKIAAIFKVQAEIIQSFQKTLKGLDFTEIQVPTIVPTKTEGGAEIFKINYYGYDAYLAQSPQLYKQIAVGVYERVFTLAHAYRAEPSETTRHLSEYLSFDVEMGFIENWEEITEVCQIMFVNLVRDLEKNCPNELVLFNTTLPKLGKKIPKIKLREAQGIIFARTGRNNRQEPDLTPEDEREICKWAKENHGSDLVFVTHFPVVKRPFYTFADPSDSEYTLSFDLLGQGLELATGGQRINDYHLLVENIKKFGEDPADFEFYLESFKFGMPPAGGFAIGVERVTAKILQLSNVKEASLFPRDMTRIDLPLTKLASGKSK